MFLNSAPKDHRIQQCSIVAIGATYSGLPVVKQFIKKSLSEGLCFATSEPEDNSVPEGNSARATQDGQLTLVTRPLAAPTHMSQSPGNPGARDDLCRGCRHEE
jgi:hypothetical protein